VTGAAERIAGLTARKRALLDRLLAERGGLPVPRASADGESPLSHAQRRLWLLHQMDPRSTAYNMPAALRLAGSLDRGALRAAVGGIVARHEILRTSFPAGPRGDAVQRVAAVRPVPVPVVELGGLAPAARDGEAARLAGEAAARPFDLAAGPVLRLTLLACGAGLHVLLLDLHHIASDGWSMGIFWHELAALYEAARRGQPPTLAPLPLQYRDFARWQLASVPDDRLLAQLAWWREHLAAAPRLALPTDRKRAAAGRTGTVRHALAAAAAAALGRLAEGEGTTLFVALLALCGALLGRWSGQDDLVVGVPAAGRSRVELEGLIGFFVNTLALRLRPRPDTTFRRLLRETHEELLETQARQDLPFERLVEELRPRRDGHAASLFQVVFQLENSGQAELDLHGLRLSPLPAAAAEAKFEIVFTVWQEASAAGLTLVYDRGLFGRDRMERLARHFGRLLAAAAASPDEALGDLPLLGAAERHQLLYECNDTHQSQPAMPVVHTLFAHQAALRPAAIAVEAEAAAWSYGEIEAAADRLAAHLRSLGVERGSRVAAAMERSADLVVALLAILKAGAAYVPLDPAYPDERLRFMLADTQAWGVLVHARTRQRLAGLGAPHGSAPRQLVCLDRDRRLIAARRTDPAPCRSLPADLAYVMYTSGSTGRPKGVAIPHRAIVRLARAADCAPLGAADRVAHCSNISFDASTFEIWGALLNGGALVVIPKEAVPAPGELARRLGASQVTAALLTTALFNQVVREEPAALRGLRHLLTGGEAADPGAMARALAHGGPGRLVNAYGPTESATIATWQRVSEVAADAVTVAIGLPLTNTTAYVLGRRQELVPLGLLGELYIGGLGLAWGYLGRPDLTAASFVPHPWSASGGGRLYRTGDLVRRRGDGAIEYLGRVDRQVKIRGFRIEPQEIEAAICALPGVTDCAVLARQDGPGDRRLVAYVVAAAGAAPSGGRLREQLGRSLPDHLLPAVFQFLGALPLTPNGKTDRAALPAPQLLAQEVGFQLPRSPVEEILVDIWEEVLGAGPVGTADNFFALGGHSLLATQVTARMRRTLGVELPVSRLFEKPTIAELAGEVAAALQGGAGAAGAIPPRPPIPSLSAAARRGGVPLSFAQQRLWFLDQLEPGNPAYSVPLAVRLQGAIEVAVLRRSCAEIVRRHEALRTTFRSTTEGPVQAIARLATVPLPVVSLAGLPERARQAEASRLGLAAARLPFDLAAGPLLRLLLLRLATQEHVLLATMHHIVADGWSVGVLLQELAALYRAFSRGEVSPLPELPIQYADFAVWQREWLSGKVLESQIDYWRRALAGVAPLALPTDRPRPPRRRGRGQVERFVLAPPLGAALAHLARAAGATPFITLLCGLAALLSRYSGQEDVALGSPVANRTSRETEGLIGFFANTLVLRADLTGSPSFEELLGRVRQSALAAYAHQDLPFEKVVEVLQPERDASRTPLFQVLFVLQHAPREGLALPGLGLAPLPVDPGTAKFDLSLALTAAEGGFAGSWEFDRDLFDRTTLARLGGQLVRLLEAVVAQPAARLGELSWLSAAESQQLREWNATAAAYPAASLAALLAAQAARTPEAVAVVCEDAALSHGELAARASRLAGGLRRLGVGPEVRVGICAERSLGLLVGLVAIVASGGAYVPLDPSYPAERLAFMLDSSGVSILLADGAVGAGLAAGAVDVGRAERRIRLVRLDDPLPSAAPASPSAGAEINPDHLAYVIYTSGSTGRPKGAMNTHRGIVNRLLWMQGRYHLTPVDRILQKTPLSFDVSVWELFLPLLTGACLVVARPGGHQDPAYLAATIARQEITLLHFVPAMLAAFVDGLGDAPCRSLRQVIASGEALTWELERRFFSRLRAALDNLYGPTEAAVDVTFWPCDPAGTSGRVPIGRPVANTAIHLLDRHLLAVPAGAAGQLAIGGVQVGRGYLGRPELTAERFVPAAIGQQPGGRLYLTGDLARHLADGTLEYLGRMDNQVKVRGFRIELGEVEAVLAAHPAVREAAVLARRDPTGELRLVAYVAATAAEGLAGRLRDHLAERLPGYMVPTVFVQLPDLPLTPNGKVDRKALPPPAAPGLPAGGGRGPRDGLELVLQQIWEELLGRVGPAIDGSFFDLGGHSLLAVRLASLVRVRLGLDLPVASLFTANTIESQAVLLRRGVASTRPASAPHCIQLAAGGAGRPLFLVHPVGGGVLCYIELVRHLRAAGGPAIWGLQRLAAPRHESIEDLARRYLQEIPRRRAIHLAGWSMGALVAYEMARQRRLAGGDVSLTLLDPPAAADATAVTDERTLLGRFAADLLQLAPGELGELLAAAPAAIDLSFDELQAEAERRRLLPHGLDRHLVRRLYTVFRANAAAAAAYRPLPCEGRLDLLLAPGEGESAAALAQRAGSWAALAAAGSGIHPVPGGHFGLLRPGLAAVWASRLGAALRPDSATATGTSPGAAAPAVAAAPSLRSWR
jgi:amino acid adenylation domain-containing protein